jgi:hypothetical protein
MSLGEVPRSYSLSLRASNQRGRLRGCLELAGLLMVRSCKWIESKIQKGGGSLRLVEVLESFPSKRDC